MATSAYRTLDSYVPWLRKLDDEWRLRVLLHDFCLVWQDTAPELRRSLVEVEPARLDPRWDAFMAALGGAAMALAYDARHRRLDHR